VSANPHAVVVDDNGQIYVSTYISGTRIFNGDTLAPSGTIPNLRTVLATWNAAGEELWASQFHKTSGSGNSYIEGLGISNDGNLMFTGSSGGTVLFNEVEISTNAGNRSFSGKINSNTGELIWVLEPEIIQNNLLTHRITAIDDHRYFVSGRGFQDYSFSCMEAITPNQSKTQFFIIIDEDLGNPIDADFSFSANADLLSFSSLASGADTWNWDFGDGSTSQEENPVHVYTEEGDYEVTLIASNCQYADTLSQNVSVIFTGIENLNSIRFELYPSPTSDILTLPRASEYSIFDAEGRLILQSRNNEKQIDVSKLKPGIYIVKSDTWVSRFVKL
jgi:PKD repeat protein